MKVVIIGTREDDLVEQVNDARARGFTTFVQKDVDPDEELGLHKFLYYRSDEELYEKLNLLKADITVEDMIR